MPLARFHVHQDSDALLQIGRPADVPGRLLNRLLNRLVPFLAEVPFKEPHVVQLVEPALAAAFSFERNELQECTAPVGEPQAELAALHADLGPGSGAVDSWIRAPVVHHSNHRGITQQRTVSPLKIVYEVLLVAC
eukprot:scaffold8478_cov286-Pinguiococcus_pyrenoidosus.AAC.4